MNIPKDLKYTSEHEWLRVEGEIGVVGITDYAQSELTDIVFVEFKVEKGDKISKGDVIATIEAVKTVADVYSPISGEVLEVNEDLTNAPDT
ncbi:MAG: glycine cleavage system protein H, partial [Candidatus Hydrothermota bacterium]